MSMSLTAACKKMGNILENLEYLTILLHNRGSAHLFLAKFSMLFDHTKYECTVSQAIYVLSLVSKAQNLFGFCWALLVFWGFLFLGFLLLLLLGVFFGWLFFNYIYVWVYIISKEPTIIEFRLTIHPLGHHTGDCLTSLHSSVANQSFWGSLERTPWSWLPGKTHLSITAPINWVWDKDFDGKEQQGLPQCQWKPGKAKDFSLPPVFCLSDHTVIVFLCLALLV